MRRQRTSIPPPGLRAEIQNLFVVPTTKAGVTNCKTSAPISDPVEESTSKVTDQQLDADKHTNQTKTPFSKVQSSRKLERAPKQPVNKPSKKRDKGATPTISLPAKVQSGANRSRTVDRAITTNQMTDVRVSKRQRKAPKSFVPDTRVSRKQL